MELDLPRLMRILPQRPPMLLLDRVTDVQPRAHARAVKCVSANEPFLFGQYPSHPIFPNVLVLEAFSQLLAVLAFASEPFDPQSKVFYQLGFDQVKFRRPIVPGDRIDLHVELLQHRSNIWKAHGTATVEKQLCAQADILVALTARDELPTT